MLDSGDVEEDGGGFWLLVAIEREGSAMGMVEGEGEGSEGATHGAMVRCGSVEHGGTVRGRERGNGVVCRAHWLEGVLQEEYRARMSSRREGARCMRTCSTGD